MQIGKQPATWVVCMGIAMTLAAAAAEIPFPAALDAAAVVETRIADLNREALPLGNGDLNGLLWQRGGALCLRVAKNDIWDARIDTSGDLPLMKVDVAAGTWSGGGYPPSWRKPYPHPRCAAVIRIGGGNETNAWQPIRALGKVNEWLRDGDTGMMAIQGKAGASAGYRWDLEPAHGKSITGFGFRIAGTPGARYYVNVLARTGKHPVASGWIDSPREEQAVSFSVPPDTDVSGVEIYIMTKDGSRVENRIRNIALSGDTPLTLPAGMAEQALSNARLDLRRAVAEITKGGGKHTTVRVLADRNAFLIDTDAEVVLEEIKTGEVPPAESGETNGVEWLHVRLPGDVDYPGMDYALAVAGDGPRKAVALVTSHDTREPVREAAARLARDTLTTAPATLTARHEAEWSRYWAASGVALDDPDFQLWWYRMVYLLRCFSKPGVIPAGLWAFQPTNSPHWHGDYHHNYNAWQPYWTPFAINHPEQAQPWIDYFNEMLPRMRWFAGATYDCEGAFIGISSFAFEPDPARCKSKNKRQIAIPPYGYTLGMIGMSAQILWLSHLYQPDRTYLEDKVYPAVHEVALFYASFAEKCPRDAQGKAVFGPSYSPEHGSFGVADVPFDLAFARYLLNAAIAAAGELERDRDDAARFRHALTLLPDYPTAPDADGKPVVVDWTGCKFRQIKTHNITVPAVPVFPGDQVTWFSPEAEKELFRNTIRQTRHRGCNSTVMMAVAKARLSMPDALEDARGYYRPQVQPNGMFYWPMHGFYLSESVGVAAMISEALLQSVDHIIRVFPAWPQEQDAAFASLRAQGGFLVSAEQKQGAIVKLEIVSTVGGRLRVVNPWTGKMVDRQTRPGDVVTIEP